MPGKTASRSTGPLILPVQTASCGPPLDSPWRGFFLACTARFDWPEWLHDRAHAEDATGHDFIDIDPPAIINQIPPTTRSLRIIRHMPRPLPR